MTKTSAHADRQQVSEQKRSEAVIHVKANVNMSKQPDNSSVQLFDLQINNYGNIKFKNFRNVRTVWSALSHILTKKT